MTVLQDIKVALAGNISGVQKLHYVNYHLAKAQAVRGTINSAMAETVGKSDLPPLKMIKIRNTYEEAAPNFVDRTTLPDA
jgi:hypothetical protein